MYRPQMMAVGTTSNPALAELDVSHNTVTQEMLFRFPNLQVLDVSVVQLPGDDGSFPWWLITKFPHLTTLTAQRMQWEVGRPPKQLVRRSCESRGHMRCAHCYYPSHAEIGRQLPGETLRAWQFGKSGHELQYSLDCSWCEPTTQMSTGLASVHIQRLH